MQLYNTIDNGMVAVVEDEARVTTLPFDELFAADDPAGAARESFAAGVPAAGFDPSSGAWRLAAPIGAQEVWAAGVTYEVSREARMAESAAAGSADVYARVYDAERPELFFKATAARVAGPDAEIFIRADAGWNVPEPELVLAVAANGTIFGYCAGNDVSSRDIEGENPLYLPQAKVYDGSAALGPALVIGEPPTDATIRLEIDRDGTNVFAGTTTTARIRRRFADLVEYLYRECSFPAGSYLMTGTGLVPEDGYTLMVGDVVSISLDGAGTLRNVVACRRRPA